MQGWTFRIWHISGRKNAIPDTLLRYPWGFLAVKAPDCPEKPTPDKEAWFEDVEECLAASFVSWDRLVYALKTEKQLQQVMSLID